MLNTYRSILCPVDFSRHSREALRQAASIARRPGGRLIVIYVDDPLLVQAAARGYNAPAVMRDTRRELERFVARSLTAAPGRSAPTTVVSAFGTPDVEIVKAARRLRCDLIVIGTHGRRGVARLFLGSTAQGVLKRSGVPVLAIPPTRRRTAAVQRRRVRR
jgi:nucleotide-binding universal stress UspA family protein